MRKIVGKMRWKRRRKLARKGGRHQEQQIWPTMLLVAPRGGDKGEAVQSQTHNWSQCINTWMSDNRISEKCFVWTVAVIPSARRYVSCILSCAVTFASSQALTLKFNKGSTAPRTSSGWRGVCSRTISPSLGHKKHKGKCKVPQKIAVHHRSLIR